MTRRRWERWAPAGALAFLLTILLGALAVGASPPDSDASAQEIASYFAAHKGGHLLDAFLVVLGGFVFYPWFLASLWRAARRAEGNDGIAAPAVLVSGMALLGPLLVLVIAWAAAGIEAGPHRDPSVAAALLDLGNASWILCPLPAVTLVVATTLAARSGPMLPTWLTRSGLPLAVLMLVGTWFGQAPVAFVLFCLWLAIVSVVLLRQVPTPHPDPVG